MDNGIYVSDSISSDCGGLNEKYSHILQHFNTWLPISGSVWVGLGCVTLLEEVCH